MCHKLYFFYIAFNCSDLKEPKHSALVRGTWLWGKFADFKCEPNYEVSVPKHPFYSCGRMGTWNHGPPTYKNNPENLLPQCTSKLF